MTDKCTYVVFVTRSQENLSSSFPFHDTKVHEILSTVLESFRIFNQQSSTGHVESEYKSISQSTMSLFCQEYCNKKRKHCVLGQRAPNLATRVTRSQRQSYAFEDDSSIIIFVSFHQFHKISSGRCPLLIFHVGITL